MISYTQCAEVCAKIIVSFELLRNYFMAAHKAAHVFDLLSESKILELPSVVYALRGRLPDSSGIYFVVDEFQRLLYIGKASSLKARWRGRHHVTEAYKGKQESLIVHYVGCQKSHLEYLESFLIYHLRPPLNAQTPVPKDTMEYSDFIAVLHGRWRDTIWQEVLAEKYEELAVARNDAYKYGRKIGWMQTCEGISLKYSNYKISALIKDRIKSILSIKEIINRGCQFFDAFAIYSVNDLDIDPRISFLNQSHELRDAIVMGLLANFEAWQKRIDKHIEDPEYLSSLRPLIESSEGQIQKDLCLLSLVLDHLLDKELNSIPTSN